MGIHYWFIMMVLGSMMLILGIVGLPYLEPIRAGLIIIGLIVGVIGYTFGVVSGASDIRRR